MVRDARCSRAWALGAVALLGAFEAPTRAGAGDPDAVASQDPAPRRPLWTRGGNQGRFIRLGPIGPGAALCPKRLASTGGEGALNPASGPIPASSDGSGPRWLSHESHGDLIDVASALGLPLRRPRPEVVQAHAGNARPGGRYDWNPSFGYPTQHWDWVIRDGRRVTLAPGLGPERGWVAAGGVDGLILSDGGQETRARRVE